MTRITLEEARKAKEEVLKILQGRVELVGVGISFDSDKAYAVKVNLSQPLPSNSQLPPIILGVPVFTQIIGDIQALKIAY